MQWRAVVGGVAAEAERAGVAAEAEAKAAEAAAQYAR